MLLFEVFQNPNEAKMVNIIAAGGMGSGHSASGKVNVAVTYLLKHNPEFAYTGPMYRIVGLPTNVVMQAASPADLIKYIQQYKHEDFNAREYFSWSKTMEGVNDFWNYKMHDDFEGGVTPQDSSVAVVVQQMGVGLDLSRLYTKHQDEPAVSALSTPAQVQEVLARNESNFKIMLYDISGAGSRIKGSDYDQYQQYIDDFESESEPGDKPMSRREFEQDTGSHFPRSYTFRGDQLKQAQEAMRTFLSGKTRIKPRKQFHPKSTGRNYVPGGLDDAPEAVIQKTNSPLIKSQSTYDQPTHDKYADDLRKQREQRTLNRARQPKK